MAEDRWKTTVENPQSEGSPVTRRSRRTWGILGTVAATLGLIMIVSFGLLDDLPPTSDEAVLSWSPNPAAASYTVVLYDAQLIPIWESEPLTSPTVTLPREVRDGIVAEVVYFWRVISIVGGERLQSPVHRFTVEP